jgi:hypothetical protein
LIRHQRSQSIARNARIAKDRGNFKLKLYPAFFNCHFGNSGDFGNYKSAKEYQKAEFDSAARSVYFLKFARPRPNPEVKH